MKLIKINADNPEKEKIEWAIRVMESGGSIVYPTDTVYGLGVNIFDENAIKKVFSLKKREFDKPLSVCVSKIEDIYEIAYLDREEEDLVRKILPGPYTIILRKKEHIPALLTAGKNKIGIRVPDNKICHDLTQKFPITTTSANISSKKASKSAQDALEQFNDSVDLILDAGVCKNGIPSTIIDITIKPPQILRKGIKFNSDIKF